MANGDLLISDVAWPDNMGLYYCKVQNSAGEDVVDMFLYPVRINFTVTSVQCYLTEGHIAAAHTPMHSPYTLQ